MPTFGHMANRGEDWEVLAALSTAGLMEYRK